MIARPRPSIQHILQARKEGEVGNTMAIYSCTLLTDKVKTIYVITQ